MALILGQRYKARLAGPLAALGREVFWLRDNPDIDPRLAGHADLSVFTPDDRVYFVARGVYSHIANYLTNKDREVLPVDGQGPVYPRDAGLCVCRVGRYILYNKRTVAPAVAARLRGIRIHVPQGYTKCAVCVVSDDAIITADDAIASAALHYNIDVCRLRPGHVVLDGFDYGFIGGASFLLEDKTLAFTGTLDAHPDRPAILSFLEKHGVRLVCLTDGPLFDIGGAIALP